MKKILTGVFLTLVFPLLASAQTTDPSQLRAQIQTLLNQVTQLQQQAGSKGSATSVAVSTGAGCPNLTRTLQLGSSGADVSALQQFLAQDPSIYPEGKVTGYFGALTQTAVQHWQAAHGIASSGTPGTTGFGVVGSRTRAAMAQECAGGSATTRVGGYMQVTPVSGKAPLNVNVQATVNTTNSCQAASYALDWGDNSAPVQIPVNPSTCTSVSQPYAHTYQAPGTYQIILSAGSHRTTAQVAVYGATQ